MEEFIKWLECLEDTRQQSKVRYTVQGGRADCILFDIVEGRRLGRPRSLGRISLGLSERVPAL